MANIKFSQLPNLGNITAATIIPVVASGTNYSVSAANLQTYVNGGAGNITSGNINATGNISATGNITGGNITTTGGVIGGSATISGTISGGNLLVSGYVSATGNITGSYIIGNGSQLTGIVTSYSNANVATYLASYTGNLQAGNIQTIGGLTVGPGPTGSQYGNIKCGNLVVYTDINTGGTITSTGFSGTSMTATGNVTGGNIVSTGRITGSLFKYSEVLTTSTGVTSYTPNFNTGPVQKITLSGNLTLAAPTNMVTGSSITLIIVQSGSGNCIMSANAAYKFAYSVNTLSTTANAIDMMSIFYDGSTYLCNLVKGYA